MFELVIAGLWLVQNAMGDKMVCDQPPKPESLVNRWAGAAVVEVKGMRLEDSCEWEIKRGVAQKIKKPEPVIDLQAQIEQKVDRQLETALRVKAGQDGVPDEEFAKLVRLKYVTPAARVSKWEKLMEADPTLDMGVK